MPWLKVDDAFHRNPKVEAVGLAGAGLYAKALAYCAEYLTDGRVPVRWARMQVVLEPDGAKLLGELEEAGLWRRAGLWFEIPDYLDFNPSKEQVELERESRSKRGRAGAAARWGDG
jgi:hypothetical protein